MRGQTAVWLVVGTAVILVLAPDARLALLALAGQYFAAALLFADVLDPRLVIVKLLVGWFVCLILYMTGRQVNWGRRPVDVLEEEAGPWQPPRQVVVGKYHLPVWGVQAALAALTLLTVLWLARQPDVSLPLIPETMGYLNLAIYALAAFGVLQMALAARPLPAGMGLFMALTGFELFYSHLDQTVLVLALLALVNLSLALGVSYLTQARYTLPGSEAWDRKSKIENRKLGSWDGL